MKCEVCGGSENVVGVCCVPGVPVSVAYCRQCLEANAHPYGIVVGNTALLGGAQNAAQWWRDMIEGTIKRLNKSNDEFLRDVAKAREDLNSPPFA